MRRRRRREDRPSSCRRHRCRGHACSQILCYPASLSIRSQARRILRNGMPRVAGLAVCASDRCRRRGPHSLHPSSRCRATRRRRSARLSGSLRTTLSSPDAIATMVKAATRRRLQHAARPGARPRRRLLHGALEPRADLLGRPSFDPLPRVIERAHAAGPEGPRLGQRESRRERRRAAAVARSRRLSASRVADGAARARRRARRRRSAEPGVLGRLAPLDPRRPAERRRAVSLADRARRRRLHGRRRPRHRRAVRRRRRPSRLRRATRPRISTTAATALAAFRRSVMPAICSAADQQRLR